MRLGLALFIVVSLVGCDPSSSRSTRADPTPRSTVGTVVLPEWSPPQDYEFDLESSCGERSLIGRFHVVVMNGVVNRTRALDERARSFMRYARDSSEEVPSLEHLLEEAEIARRDGADIVEVVVDPADGYPTRIDIDYNEAAIDDESCYVISHYAELVDCNDLCISDTTVAAGQEVTITFAPPKKQTWGVDAELRLREGKRIGWLYSHSRKGRLKTVWPSPNQGFPRIGISGHAKWTWTVPHRLEPGVYEIEKNSVRHGSAPVEERITTWTAVFEVTQ